MSLLVMLRVVLVHDHCTVLLVMTDALALYASWL
jgi:hypothetical protein